MDQSMGTDALFNDAKQPFKLKEKYSDESDVSDGNLTDDGMPADKSTFPDGYFTAAFSVAQLVGKNASQCI